MLGKLFSMLGTTPWNQFFDQNTEFSWLSRVFDYLYPTLYAVMAVAGAIGSIYAVWLGIQLAKAEDQSKRDEARKRLIYTLVAVAAVILLVVFFNELLPYIINAIVGQPNGSNTPTHGDNGGTGGAGTGGFISPVAGFIKTFIR